MVLVVEELCYVEPADGTTGVLLEPRLQAPAVEVMPTRKNANDVVVLEVLKAKAAGATRLPDTPFWHFAQQTALRIFVDQVLLIDLLRLPPGLHFQTRDSTVPRFQKLLGYRAFWPDLRWPGLLLVVYGCDYDGVLLELKTRGYPS